MPVEQETVVEGQETGQEVQPEVQPEAVADDGMYVRIPRSNYSHLADDGDFNKVVHLGNQYRDAEKSGLVALGQALADANMDPYSFLSAWNSDGEAPQNPPQQQQQQAQQVQQQEPGQVQFKTQEEFDQAVDQRATAIMTEGRQEDRQTQQTTAARDAQETAITGALDSLGYKSAPIKFALAGTDHELSPVRDLIVGPAVRMVAHRIHAQGLNSHAPDYQDSLYAPMSAQTVEEASKIVKQVMGLIGQSQLEAEADTQADLPLASLGDGPPGGRVKPNTKDMTAEQKREAFEQWERDRIAEKEGG